MNNCFQTLAHWEVCTELFSPSPGAAPLRDMRAANTKGIALIASGTYNAGEGLVTEAEEDFAEAFEMFAPVRTTRSDTGASSVKL